MPPDAASCARLQEHQSAIFSERYADYLQLGVEEWRKSYAEHAALGKKAVLFVMVDDTRNCDEVGVHLERICPELQGAVLVIHTKFNGENSEAASGKSKEELEVLRKASNEIDGWASPCKAIVSVLMLKEGWDVRKDIDALDIQIPRLARRFNREFRDLADLDPPGFNNQRLPLKAFSPEETREIVFKTMLDDAIHHTIVLDGAGPADYRSVVGFFARQLLKELRLVGGYELLYPKVKSFIAENLFAESPVDLEDPVVLRNLSEPDASKIIFDTFKSAINALTVQDSGSSRIEDYIRLRDTWPFRTEHRDYLQAKKSVFSKIVGEANAGGFELKFARFLDEAPDVASFAKNYLAVGFKIDYVRANGDLSNYIPDFLAKTADGTVWIIETKGAVEIDPPQKMNRLRQWCMDASAASQAQGGPRYRFVYVDQAGYERNPPHTLSALVQGFTEYQAPTT